MFGFFPRHKAWRIITITVGTLLLIAAAMPILVTVALSPQLGRYIESDEFRVALERETAKGLHFPSGHYEPIKRTGTWTAESAGFQAKHGWKAMSSMDARGIKVKFSPWGVFFRRWQLDEVRIHSGEVGIQVYEPKPEPTPAKPWFHIFLPERVYLKRVESDPVDVTWQFRGHQGGFFGTRLVITPHGRDFNYQATGGTMKSALIPELRLQRTQMLITKTWLTLYNLDLRPKTSETGSIHAEGKAGTGEDKSVDCKIDIDRLPIGDWLPSGWQDHVSGAATGTVHWKGKNPKLETSQIEAALRVDDGRVSNLPILEKLARLTNEKELERLALNCSLELVWNYPNAEVKNIVVEDKGKFRVEGKVKIENKSLGAQSN